MDEENLKRNLCDPLENGAERKVRPEKMVCRGARDGSEGLELEERRNK